MERGEKSGFQPRRCRGYGAAEQIPLEGSHGRCADASSATQYFSSDSGEQEFPKKPGLIVANFYPRAGQKIAPRLSVALFALLSITMVVFSFFGIVLLAIARVYRTYLVFPISHHPPPHLRLFLL